MDRQESSGLTSLGFGVLAFNSVLAIYTSWGDAASVATVLAADAALVLLFLCLRAFEQGGRERERDAKIKTASLWVLTTLLTAMLFSGYPSKGALAPLVAGALVFLCLREFNRAQFGLGGQYAELFKMVLGIAACDSALAHHHARGDAGSLLFVFIAYVGFLTLTWLFLRRFDDRARGSGQ
jgi:hypothetical protein